jgi:monoamine oxidase
MRGGLCCATECLRPRPREEGVPKSVIIVGGGIAGLAAARELARNKCVVTLLEAKPRLGGRICTIRPSGWPVELGAEFIHGRSPPLLQAIQSAGLHARRMPDKFRLWANGRWAVFDFWEKISNVIERVPLNHSDTSFESFLESQQLDPLTRSLALAYAEGFNAAPADRLSAQAVVQAQRAADAMHGDWQGRVTEGYSALVEFYRQEIEQLGGRIVLNAKVKAIAWRPGRVEVTWGQGQKIGRLEADAAVSTFSLGVWKSGSIRFSPSLKQKDGAARQMGFGNVLKLVLQFQRRWWPASANGILQGPGEPLPTWWGDPRGPVLTAWVGGPRADALRSLPARTLERLALEVIERLFAIRAAEARKLLTKVYFHRWEADPDIRGAYSYIPVSGRGLPNVLAAPLAGTLFFAGEATVSDAQTGTVFGALTSGERAASEVLESWRTGTALRLTSRSAAERLNAL